MSGTIFSFDRPDEREFTIPTQLPWLPADASIEIAGESHLVRSSGYVIDVASGDVTLYVRLR